MNRLSRSNHSERPLGVPRHADPRRNAATALENDLKPDARSDTHLAFITEYLPRLLTRIIVWD